MATIGNNNQVSATQNNMAATGAVKKSPADVFLAYMKMTPGEKMRAAVLGMLGYTEEELKVLPPEERRKIEEKIKELIKQKLDEEMQKDGKI